MTRQQFLQLIMSLGVAGFCACTGMQEAKADSDFEGAAWKQFVAKAANEVIIFEFPINLRATTTFEFHPRVTEGESLVIALRTNERMGWVHATSGISILIHVDRFRGTNPDGSWSAYSEFASVQEAFDVIQKQELKVSNPTRSHSLVTLGNRHWVKTVGYWSESGSHEKDVYRSVLNKDYLISVSIGLGSRGKADEIRLVELRKVGERIVKSIRVQQQ